MTNIFGKYDQDETMRCNFCEKKKKKRKFASEI